MNKISLWIVIFISMMTLQVEGSEVYTPPREQWMAVFFESSQVGYTNERIIPEIGPDGNVTGFGVSGNVEMNIPAGGMVFDVKLTQIVFLNLDFSIRNFDFEMDTGGSKIRCRGSIEENQLKLTADSAGTLSTETRNLGGPIYLPEALSWIIGRDKPQVGEKVKMEIYDPLNTQLGIVEAEVLDKTTLSLDGIEYPCLHVKQSYMGFEQESWIAEEGTTLREMAAVAGLPFKTEKTTEGKAKAFGANPTVQSLDLIDSSQVPVNVQLKDPHGVKKVKYRVKGISPDFIPNNSQQKVTEKSEDSFILEIESLLVAPDTLPKYLGDTKRYEAFLGSSLLIQSDNEKIQKESRSIVNEELSPYQKVEKLSHWLYRNIDKEFRMTIPSAAEVLKTRRGDCNEHSVLLTALARASGLPSKICTGMVYQDGSFWYHAWNEVLVSTEPEVWLPVDSTIGGNFVDATHIKLAEGDLLDSGSNLGSVMGKISLEILEYE